MLNEIIQTIREKNPGNVGVCLYAVINKLLTLGVRANYDPIPPAGDINMPTRVLFYASRYTGADMSECNGIIYDYTTWKVLYRPLPLPNARFNVQQVEQNYDQYDVYELNDGTVVGLYYYQGRWCIATTHGIDMGGVVWNGISYFEALTEAMASAKFPGPDSRAAATAGEIDEPPARALTWEELDVDVSYTFGFTHKKMHYSQFCGMWIIRAVVTETGDKLDLAQFEMPQQRLVSGEFKTFAALQAACNDTHNTSWGYILRSRNPEITGANTTVLVESRRMQMVRTTLYNREINREAVALGVNKQHYIFVKNLLTRQQREIYIRLFPDQTALLDKSMAAITSLAGKVISPGKKSAEVAWFRDHVAAKYNLTGMTRNQAMDFILIPDNISQLINFLEVADVLV